MAIARLSVILVLVVYLLQASQGQQGGFCSNSNLGPGNSLTISTEPLIGVITPGKQSSQTCKCENNRSTQNKPLLTGLQQFLNLQQPHQSSMTGTLNLQPLSMNLQSALGGQNSQQQLSIQQQSTIPSQQALKSQQTANLQSSNQKPQPCIQSQSSWDTKKQSQNLQASLNLQPINLEKIIQQPVSQGFQSNSLNNFQTLSQQTPMEKDISFDLLPMINGQAQGLPSQVTQGILLSNLGLSSNLPSILPSSSTKTSSKQCVPSQNNAASLTIQPTSLGASQTANALPISVSSFRSADDYTSNKPTQILLMPLSFQSNNPETRPQTIDLTLSPLSASQSQEAQNQVKSFLPIQIQQALQVQQPVPDSIQTYPIQSQNAQTYATHEQNIPIQLVQQQATTLNQQPSQMRCTPTQLTPSQPISIAFNPVTSTQTQPIQEYNSLPVQNQQKQIPFDGQSNPLASLLLSQLQSSNSPSIDSNNQASKSSSMKSWLPLLFNLIKDKNGGCCCPNCNCGYAPCNNAYDRQGMNPLINNPFMQSYNNDEANTVEQTEESEEPTTNTYLIYNNTPYLADNENQNDLKPQITNDYANQIKYGQPIQKDVSQNIVESEERGFLKKAQDKKKTSAKEYQNPKKVRNESAEYENYDDYGYSYENED